MTATRPPFGRRPRTACAALLLAGGTSLALVAAAGPAGAAAAPAVSLTVPVRSGNSGAAAGSATFVRSALPGGGEHLQVSLTISRPGGGDGSHLCLSALAWQAKANFPDCAYADPSMHQPSFSYQVDLGSVWTGKVVNVQLQTRVDKVGNPTHTENAYAGWQPHGNTQEGDQYGQVALPALGSPSTPTAAPSPTTRAGGSAPPAASPQPLPDPAATPAPVPTVAVQAVAATPGAPAAATLPFTGPDTPVSTLLLTALALVLAGLALLLAGTVDRADRW